MLKKIHILLILNLLLISTLAFAQGSTRFKRFYDLAPYTWGSYSMNVTTLSDGYLLSGIVSDTADGYLFNRLTLLKVDTLGNPVWEKRYGNRKFQFVQDGWNMSLKDSALYFSSAVVKLDSAKNTTAFLKFDLNGDSLWGKEYDYLPITTNNTWFVLLGRNGTPDGGFVFSGYKSNGTIGDNGIVLLKTDSLGNEEWRSIMNTTTYSSSGVAVIFDTVSQRYIISAIHKPPGTPSYGYASIVIYTDINGNKLSQYTLSDSYGGWHNSIIQSQDNNFVLSGWKNTGEMTGGVSKQKYQALQINSNGNIIWQREYGFSGRYNSFWGTFKLPDGNILLTGSLDSLNNLSMGVNIHFYIQKINQNGDSLWARTVDMINQQGVYNNFSGLDLTPDNGMVLTGFFFGTLPNADKKFCIAKIDEWGCDTADCQLVGINELNKNNFEFLVYPNPANDNLIISCNNGVSMDYYEIIDISGKISATEKISSINFSINIQQLNQGIYALRLFDKNKNVSVKRFSVVH